MIVLLSATCAIGSATCATRARDEADPTRCEIGACAAAAAESDFAIQHWLSQRVVADLLDTTIALLVTVAHCASCKPAAQPWCRTCRKRCATPGAHYCSRCLQDADAWSDGLRELTTTPPPASTLAGLAEEDRARVRSAAAAARSANTPRRLRLTVAAVRAVVREPRHRPAAGDDSGVPRRAGRVERGIK